MKRYNLYRPEIVHDEGDPDGYNTGYDRIGPKIGASQMGATIYEMPPGQALCPYHYEYPEEEWLIVLEGTPTLREPGGSSRLEPWDVVCFPTGPSGAHGVRNETGAAVYPDSDKVGVWTGNPDDDVLVHRSSRVPYFSGETGAGTQG